MDRGVAQDIVDVLKNTRGDLVTPRLESDICSSLSSNFHRVASACAHLDTARDYDVLCIETEDRRTFLGTNVFSFAMSSDSIAGDIYAETFADLCDNASWFGLADDAVCTVIFFEKTDRIVGVFRGRRVGGLIGFTGAGCWY